MMGKLVTLSDYQSVPNSSVPLANDGDGGDSSGMDPWQQSVETRLGELRQDTRTIAADVSTLKTDVATVTERVGHLPTKGFIVSATMATLAVVAALALFGENLRAFLHLS